MAAFDVVAGGPVADFPTEGGVLVFAPAPPAIALSTFVAVVLGGVGVGAALATITVTAPLAAVYAGSLVTAPAPPVVSLDTPAASVQISATVTAPARPVIAVTAPLADILAGGAIGAGLSTINVTAPLAAVTAGKSVFAPVATIGVNAPVAVVAIGLRLLPPVATIAISAPAAVAVGGNFIEASNDLVITISGGEVAGAAVAEFSVTDGPAEVFARKVPPTIVVGLPPAFVFAGASVFAPTANIAVSAPLADINARRRKLRLMAIAS